MPTGPIKIQNLTTGIPIICQRFITAFDSTSSENYHNQRTGFTLNQLCHRQQLSCRHKCQSRRSIFDAAEGSVCVNV
ncbi:MAG: hypothetical protein EZS28_056587, partial [Streblomastix strix]